MTDASHWQTETVSDIAPLSSLPVKAPQRTMWAPPPAPTSHPHAPPPAPRTFPRHVHPPATLPKKLGKCPFVDDVWLRAAALRTPFPVIGVASADGGVGKSTLTAVLSTIFQLACPSPVAAIDMSERAWSGLEHRVHRSSRTTKWDAIDATHLLHNRTIADKFMQIGPHGLRVLLSDDHATYERPPLQFDVALRLLTQLRLAYPLTCLDLPSSDTTGMWQGLAYSSATILTSRATIESIHHTLRLLGQLRTRPHGESQANRVVAAIVHSATSREKEIAAAKHTLETQVEHVISIPYDTHLAVSGPIDPLTLHRSTRNAFMQLAAAALQYCPSDPQLAAQRLSPNL